MTGAALSTAQGRRGHWHWLFDPHCGALKSGHFSSVTVHSPLLPLSLASRCPGAFEMPAGIAQTGFGLSGEALARRWAKALLGTIAGGALGFALVIGLRAVSGLDTFQTEQTGYPHIVVPAITAPLGFLVGFGALTYWFRWAIGAPTQIEDHADHGAASWRDYFTFNTDHKVIGVQYIVTTFFFFFIGGLLAMLIRAELA